MGGDTDPPDTATRIGCATLPSRCHPPRRPPDHDRVQFRCAPLGKSPRGAARTADRSGTASAVRCFAAALSSYAVQVTEEEQAVASAISFSVLARSCCALRDGRHPGDVVAWRLPSAASCGARYRGESLRRRTHDVLLVGPQQLVRVQRRRRLVDVDDVEQLRHLLEREDLLVAMRPAEAPEVVEQPLRQEAVVAVLEHADRAVPLRQLRAVRTQDHRHVRIDAAASTPSARSMLIWRGVLLMWSSPRITCVMRMS